MSLDGSRLEYKLDSRKLERYKSKCPGGLSHAHAGPASVRSHRGGVWITRETDAPVR